MQQHFRIGPIRPPSEANSLLLRITQNCSWNKCDFCTLYKGKKFSTRPVAEIKADIDVIVKYRDMILSNYKNNNYDIDAIKNIYNSITSSYGKMCFQMVFTWLTEGGGKAVFLQDANTMVIRPSWLIEILSYIKEKLPEVNRITSYGRADAIAKISVENLIAMKKAGLNRIHSGYESGSDKVLQFINKGITQEDEILGGQAVKKAGIELSIYFMPGVGGKELTYENAFETAKVINQVNPNFIRIRTFVLKDKANMKQFKSDGLFTECTDIEKVKEIRALLEHIDPDKVNGKITSDHIVNLLDGVDGYLNKDIPNLLKYIDSFLDLPIDKQKEFQLARRMGFPLDWNHINQMSSSDITNIHDIINSLNDEKEWEHVLWQYLNRYI